MTAEKKKRIKKEEQKRKTWNFMAHESSYDNIYFKIKNYTLFADCHFFGTTYFVYVGTIYIFYKYWIWIRCCSRLFLFPKTALLYFYKHWIWIRCCSRLFLFPKNTLLYFYGYTQARIYPNSADAAAADAERTLISPPDPHPIAPRDKILPLGKPSLSTYERDVG